MTAPKPRPKTPPAKARPARRATAARAADVPPEPAAFVDTLDGERVPAAELAHLHPFIQRYAVRADSLTRDPDNARLHTERNLRAIANSLRLYGQQPLILTFDPQSRVIKVGNGRHEVATDPTWGLNWRWVAAIPSNLPAAELKAFALADNRTAELAEWDPAVVERQLRELSAELDTFAAGEIGFDVAELDALLKGKVAEAHGFVPARPRRDPPPATDGPLKPQWLVIVKCKDEAQQAEMIEEMERRGIECTAPSA